MGALVHREDSRPDARTVRRGVPRALREGRGRGSARAVSPGPQPSGGCGRAGALPPWCGGETGSGGATTTASGGGGATTTTITTTGGGGTGGASFEPVIVWKPCALDSKKASGNDAECADVVVPADWALPSGPTINVFVKRWPV